MAFLRDLAREGPVSVRVAGTCMVPELADGQQVQVSASRFYWPGDVVVFANSSGKLVAHRLIGYRPRSWRLWLITQSDEAGGADPAMAPEQVVGRVVTASQRPPTLAVRLRSVMRFVRVVLTRLAGRLR